MQTLTCQQDKYIYHIVQLQHIMEEADALSEKCISKAHTEDIELQSTKISLTTQVAQLRANLESTKTALPFSLTESPLLMMHYHSVMVYLCHINVSTDAALDVLTTGERWPRWRLDALCTGLVSAKSSLSPFLSLPLGSEMHFNNSEWLQLGFSITYCARFAALSYQKPVEHETQYLRNFLDMSDILREVTSRLRTLSTPNTDNDGKRDVFYQYRQHVEQLQRWFESQSKRAEAEQLQRSSATNTGNNHVIDFAGTQSLREDPSDTQLLPNSSQPLLYHEAPANSAEESWSRDAMLNHGSGESFPLDLVDFANFGQYFAFDGDIA